MSGRKAIIEYRNWLNQQLSKMIYEVSFGRFFRTLKSLGGHYNPDQPRDWHGRWTITGDDAGFADVSSWGDYAGVGHHYVAREAFKGLNLSDEANRVFEKATTGHLKDPRSNTFDKVHREYNKAVGDALKDYISQNNIRPEEMTKVEAEKFVDQVKRSTDPRIRQLNMRIWMREIMRSIRLFRGRE